MESPTLATASPEELGGTNGTRRLEADAICVKAEVRQAFQPGASRTLLDTVVRVNNRGVNLKQGGLE
jgi:hypothetical protein